MKIIYEENELEQIEESYRQLHEKGRGMLFDWNNLDRTYGLTFKVTKPGLAEYILVGLLYNKLKDFDLGFEVQSIEFDTMQNTSDVKEKLHRMIDEIVK